ncbi:MAG TPA: MarR family transcriptional regulator [Baekduia sp.]|nr:MarR family transcriptional regulator [Baekduia sp.]
MPEAATPRLSAASEAWRLVGELWHEQKQRVTAIASEFELSPPQVWALRSLDPDDPVPMSALAETLRCDASNVTGIVDRLQDRGLVERRPAQHDRRVKHLVLTERGTALRAQLLARLDAPPAPIAALSPEDQRLLRDLLRRALD